MTVAIGDIKRILVVGAGQMGAQIAMQSALHGYAVTLNDLSAAILEKAMAGNRGHLDRRVAKGQMSQAEMDTAVGGSGSSPTSTEPPGTPTSSSRRSSSGSIPRKNASRGSTASPRGTRSWRRTPRRSGTPSSRRRPRVPRSA